MKKYFLYICVLFLSSCSTKVTSYAREYVEYISDDRDAIILRSSAYGKNIEEAMSNAELAAVKTLLFRGIPNSNSSRGMLAGVNEQDIQRTHSQYFNELFNNKRYRSFIVSSTPITLYDKKNNNITINIKVNTRALRLDLEQSNIIRKFGF